jgi:hypothetical protein
LGRLRFQDTVKSAISGIGLSGKCILTGRLTESFELNQERFTVLCWANAAAPYRVNSGEKDKKCGMENGTRYQVAI